MSGLLFAIRPEILGRVDSHGEVWPVDALKRLQAETAVKEKAEIAKAETLKPEGGGQKAEVRSKVEMKTAILDQAFKGTIVSALFSGPKAGHVKAWAEASPASAGPGNPFDKIHQGLKGRNNFAAPVPPFQGGEDSFRMFTWGFTPGSHMTGFQPSEQRRIVAELDALQAEVDGLKRLQAETAAELNAVRDQAFQGEL